MFKGHSFIRLNGSAIGYYSISSIMKPLSIFIALAVIAPSLVHGAVILVDTQTNNGGFESGLESPWVDVPTPYSPSASGSLSIVQTPTPYQGIYSGSLNASGPSSGGAIYAEVYMPLSLSEANGNILEVSLYASAASQALNTLTISLTDSATVNYSPIILTQGTINADQWTQFVYRFVLPETYEFSGTSKLTFQMGRDTTEAGKKYAGYIDAVTVTQAIPESSAIVLLLGCAVFYLSIRFVRTTAN